MKDYKIEIESTPFSWNDKMADLAIEDFESVRSDLSYCQCQSIGLALAKLRMIEGGKMNDPAHIDIIHKIPEYKRGTKKGDKRKIKEIMHQYEIDDDVIENISDDFCDGWDVARYIIIEMLKDKYWKFQEKINERIKLNEQ